MRARGWVAGVALLAAAGCTRDAPPPPTVLVDGLPARPPPVELDRVERAVMTHVRVLPSGSIEPGSSAARCFENRRDGAVVERIGVDGTTLTSVGAGRREVYGCDAAAVRPAHREVWCGRAFARLHGGRLRDPRLSLTCRTPADDPLGFAWAQPVADASYVVVARRGYGEVYPVAGEVPVRVTTDDVDSSDASAAFSISEHGPDGRLLRSYVLEPRVSG